MKKETAHLISTLSKATSANFCGLLYESKGTKEKSKYVVNLNVDLTRVYQEDLEFLKKLFPTLDDTIEIAACGELISSLENSLENGIGNNTRYTQKNVEYIHFHTNKGKQINGIKMHPDTGELLISGFVVHKTVIEKGEEKKPVNSRPKTIAKDKIRKQLKSDKLRQFCVSHIGKVRLNGETIEFEE